MADTPRTHVFSGSPYEELAGYARAVVVDDRIFVSGTVGADATTGQFPEDTAEQAKHAFATIETALVKAQSGLHDVVRIRIYLSDPADLPAVATVVKDRVGFTYPANTTVVAQFVVPDAKIEIEVEAIRGSGTPRR